MIKTFLKHHKKRDWPLRAPGVCLLASELASTIPNQEDQQSGDWAFDQQPGD